MVNSTKERRQKQRRRAVRYGVTKSWTVSLDSLHKGSIDNLSLYGLFVNTERALPVNSIVNIQLLLPDKPGKTLNIKSKVIWLRKDRDGNFVGMGLEFLEQSSEENQVISFYIDTLKKEREEER